MPVQARLIGMSDEERATALAGPAEDFAVLLVEAAEAGHLEAQLLAGQIYLDGNGVEKDAAEGLRWFGIAAKSGNVMAMNMVGRCCEHGWGTAVDKGLAAQWYATAADGGLDWAMYNLATLYALGDGVSQDREEALHLFERAAALGHAKSMNMIGSFYEDGWVAERDQKQAACHYQRSAEAGDFRGQFNHARMLVDQDNIEEAGIWLTRMAETATPAFLKKSRAWMVEQSDPVWHRDLIGVLERAISGCK